MTRLRVNPVRQPIDLLPRRARIAGQPQMKS